MRSILKIFTFVGLLISLYGIMDTMNLDDIELNQECSKEVKKHFHNSVLNSRIISLVKNRKSVEDTILVEIDKNSFFISVICEKSEFISDLEVPYENSEDINDTSFENVLESISSTLKEFKCYNPKEICVVVYESTKCEFLNENSIVHLVSRIKEDSKRFFLDGTIYSSLYIPNEFINYINKVEDNRKLIRLKTKSKDLIICLKESFSLNLEEILENVIVKNENEKIIKLGNQHLKKSTLTDDEKRKMFLLLCFERFLDLDIKKVKNGVLTKYKYMMLTLLKFLMNKKRFAHNLDKFIEKITNKELVKISETMSALIKEKKKFSIDRNKEKQKTTKDFYNTLLKINNENLKTNIYALRFVFQVFTILVRRFDILAKIICEDQDEVNSFEIDNLKFELKEFTKKYWINWSNQFIKFLQRKRLRQKNNGKVALGDFKKLAGDLRKSMEKNDIKTIDIPIPIYIDLKKSN